MKDITNKINEIRSYTPKVGVLGDSGVGKSSLCNALFGKEVAKVSDVEACTRTPQEIRIGSGDGSGGIILVDLPGIGETPARHKEYTALYKSILPELDLVLWAIKSDDRKYDSGLDSYSTIFRSEQTPPVLFVVTQTDKTNDIENWNHKAYKPDGSQIGNIALKENAISRLFDISARNIVSIAVSKRGASYNLMALIDRVVEMLPNEKKYSFTREAKEENVSDTARESAEKGVWDTIKEFAGTAWDSIKDNVAEVLVSSASLFMRGWLKKWR